MFWVAVLPIFDLALRMNDSIRAIFAQNMSNKVQRFVIFQCLIKYITDAVPVSLRVKVNGLRNIWLKTLRLITMYPKNLIRPVQSISVEIKIPMARLCDLMTQL